MEQPDGHPCPECGAPRQRDNTPSCACTHRAAEALRDARTAEAAAAEDFDPLRIRPYVEITGPTGSGRDVPAGENAASRQGAEGREGHERHEGLSGDVRPAGPAANAEAAGSVGAAGAAAASPVPSSAEGAPTSEAAPAGGTVGTVTTPAAPAPPASSVPAGSSVPPASSAPPGSPTDADATTPFHPVDPDATAALPVAADTTALSAPLVPGTSEPSVTDLRLFDGSGAEPGAPEADGPGADRPRRRRRTALVAAAAACVGVVAAAGYATGLFTYESPSRDTALPDDLRASVPDAPPSSAASVSPEGTPSAGPSSPSASPASPSPSASASPSPSPSVSSASPSPSRSPGPSSSATSAAPTGPGVPENAGQNGGPTVLRRGDSGPEVTELQLRLRQLLLYNDEADGSYNQRLEDAVRTYQWSRGVQTDDLGVYDRQTREKLEAETREP